jgi:hypothetical protein
MQNMVYNPKGINPMAANAFAASTMACACGMVYGDVIQHGHCTQIRVVLLVTLLLVLPGDVTQHVVYIHHAPSTYSGTKLASV